MRHVFVYFISKLDNSFLTFISQQEHQPVDEQSRPEEPHLLDDQTNVEEAEAEVVLVICFANLANVS